MKVAPRQPRTHQPLAARLSTERDRFSNTQARTRSRPGSWYRSDMMSTRQSSDRRSSVSDTYVVPSSVSSQWVTRVSPDQDCRVLTVFPGPGCLTCSAPSITARSADLVTRPATVRVSEMRILGSRRGAVEEYRKEDYETSMPHRGDRNTCRCAHASAVPKPGANRHIQRPKTRSMSWYTSNLIDPTLSIDSHPIR